MSLKITRREIFDIWVPVAGNEKLNAVLNFVCKKIKSNHLDVVDVEKLKQFLRAIVTKIQTRYMMAARHQDRFFFQNSAWLAEDLNLSQHVYQELPSTSRAAAALLNVSCSGRPNKEFEQSALRTKKRKAKELLESTSQQHLIMATEMTMRSSGKKNSASIVNELFNASPHRGSVIKKLRKSNDMPKSLTSDQALAMMIDLDLLTHQYESLKKYTKLINPKLYPSYNQVRQAKLLCYPSNIKVCESFAEIELQSLVDHTIRRLCTAQKEIFSNRFDLCGNALKIIIKWGCDGADQNRYKQKFSDGNGFDESLLSISMVPIKMFSCSNKNVVVWQNPAPSSVRYCRPIKFNFTKETPQTTLSEVKHITDQISLLTPTHVKIDQLNITVKATFILCMIDGKVCNTLSSNASSQTCYICHATPRLMNQAKYIADKLVDEAMLSFGLSPLHARIRFMECLLHIAYKLDFRKWQARGAELEKKVRDKKLYIQERFRSEMGLLVDMPKQKSGNSNDGNTARKFFRNSELSLEITGINLELIQRFHIILECLGCGFPIDPTAFGKFAEETRNLYLANYAWYYMPVTVHKVLFHGERIISSCILPIGQLSEEAQEARNKDSRRFRESFTRKTSRIDTNEDLLHRLLISSDPFINSLRQPPKYKRSNLTVDVIKLLKAPEFIEANSDTDSE